MRRKGFLAVGLVAGSILGALGLLGCGSAPAAPTETVTVPAESPKPKPPNLDIEPNVGLGDLRLGETKAALDSALGEPKQVGAGFEYKIPGGKLGAGFNTHGRPTQDPGPASHLATIYPASDGFAVGGVPKDSPYRIARAAFPRWQSLTCSSPVAGTKTLVSERTTDGLIARTIWTFYPGQVATDLTLKLVPASDPPVTCESLAMSVE